MWDQLAIKFIKEYKITVFYGEYLSSVVEQIWKEV